jgi:hypothetical protein
MSIAALVTTNTFRDWFNKTNEIITALNANTMVAGAVATGTFVVNGSLQVVNTFLANSTVVHLRGNTTFAANVVATANCNVWNFSCAALVIQPTNGTIVNTAITINAFSTFLGQGTFFANLTFNNDITQAGNTLINGALTVNAQPLFVRQVLFSSANAICAPAALANPQYDDFTDPALAGCSILYLTPNIDTVFTGLTAPVNVPVGGCKKIILNASDTFQLSLASANTSSGINNRFKFPNDITVIVPPGGMIELVWVSTNHQWRATSLSNTLIPTLTVLGNTTISGRLNVTNVASFGNTTINGWLNVATTLQIAGTSLLTGNATFSGFANIAQTLQVTGISTLTGNVSTGGFANVGATLQVAGNTIINGARCFANGQLRCDTTNGRLVLPVGTNLWAV